MSVSNGLDKLQKEIDALTYNSRTVLNALIRSVMASGSEAGFTVTRVSIPITLTRVNIYRLYTFYREWEANNFAINSSNNRVGNKTFKTFTEILAQQDAVPVTLDNGTQVTSATTDAVVKHSKILYMTLANVNKDAENSINNEYWVKLIEDSQNPKLISNSSPIPINLRTPVFDPNLSTQKYNNQPTYLFPYQYFNLTSFGYSGDDTDHNMGGKSWTIQADDFISLFSGAVSVGSANLASIFKTPDRRNFDYLNGTPRIADPYSFVWGYDTFARGAYSTAGGLSSVVPFGCDGAISIGYNNIASSQYAASVGGLLNSTSGTGGGVFAGSENTVSGQFGGILAGVNNVVGGPVYNWKFNLSNAVSDCVFIEANCSTELTNTLGRNVIYINGNVSDAYIIGDRVRFFDFTTTSGNTTNNTYFMTNGDAWEEFNTTISGASSYDSNTNLTSITVLDTIPYSTAITGGRISLLERTVSGTTYNVGYASMALGESLIAMGAHQTVIGHNNRPLLSPLFIIGNSNNNSTTGRSNIVEVYDDNVILYGTPSRIGGPKPPPMINYINVSYIDYNYDEGFLGFQVNSQFIEATASANRFHIDSGSFDLMAYINTNSKSSGLQYPDPLTIGGISLTNLGGAVRIGAYEYLDTFTPLNKYDVGIFATDDIFIETNKSLNVFSKGFTEFNSTGDFYITAAGNIILDGNSVIIKNGNTGTTGSSTTNLGSSVVDILPNVTAINFDNGGNNISANFETYINALSIDVNDSYFNYYFNLDFSQLQKRFANPSIFSSPIPPSTITIVLDSTINLGNTTTAYMSTSRFPTSSILSANLNNAAPPRGDFNLAWYEVIMNGNNISITKWSTYNVNANPIYDTQIQMLFLNTADNMNNVIFNGTHNKGISTIPIVSIYPSVLSLVPTGMVMKWRLIAGNNVGSITTTPITSAASIANILSGSAVQNIKQSLSSTTTGLGLFTINFANLKGTVGASAGTSAYSNFALVSLEITYGTTTITNTDYKLNVSANVIGTPSSGILSSGITPVQKIGKFFLETTGNGVNPGGTITYNISNASIDAF